MECCSDGNLLCDTEAAHVTRGWTCPPPGHHSLFRCSVTRRYPLLAPPSGHHLLSGAFQTVPAVQQSVVFFVFFFAGRCKHRAEIAGAFTSNPIQVGLSCQFAAHAVVAQAKQWHIFFRPAKLIHNLNIFDRTCVLRIQITPLRRNRSRGMRDVAAVCHACAV